MTGRIGTFLSNPIKTENMPPCLLHELQSFCVGLITQYKMQMFQAPSSPNCKAKKISTPKTSCFISFSYNLMLFVKYFRKIGIISINVTNVTDF